MVVVALKEPLASATFFRGAIGAMLVSKLCTRNQFTFFRFVVKLGEALAFLGARCFFSWGVLSIFTLLGALALTKMG